MKNQYQKQQQKQKRKSKSSSKSLAKVCYLLIDALLCAIIFVIPYEFYLKPQMFDFLTILVYNIFDHIVCGFVVYYIIRNWFDVKYGELNLSLEKWRRWTQQFISVMTYTIIIYTGLYDLILNISDNSGVKVLIILLISLSVSAFSHLSLLLVRRSL